VTELVIKGDKTTPEYGGGLCQVGTTTFRVALNTGLPIIERRNHSYRVSYYEPAGTDATIYDPSPDLKFVNDTAGHILIQTKITGNTLRFEFWGTSDGRQVTQTKPEIYNITQPGPTKIVETQELAPGQKKCTESAHAGADTVFYRTITYMSGEKKEETWKSHYVPWQAVCLVGVEKPAEPSITETESTPLASESISGTN
jgi:vancomycin resistance protein YoaR